MFALSFPPQHELQAPRVEVKWHFRAQAGFKIDPELDTVGLVIKVR